MPIKDLIAPRRRAIRRSRAAVAALGLICLLATPPAVAEPLDIAQNFAASLTAMPAPPLGVTGSFYVPAYSSVSMSKGKLRADFSVTLSVHNASETMPLVIRRIAYFDTAGQLVESFLKAPVALKPFSTIEAYVASTDIRGGTGANFVVDWAASGEIAEPVVEALMIGSIASGHYAFITQGRPVKTVGKTPDKTPTAPATPAGK
ncbi:MULTISPECIES: DUF3124 domain-containing protein [Rhodopseudomonas]|uniref:DUF3124 domain-containing protein n=1 Tax=Rhodopseudomonas TaxID=1073 RepID=UPI0005C85DF6|nr:MULTISPECIES: DUF3124 domain-containing protein [Rhodopseudomonas]MDF3813053.1 DUF3124 domain-containing protein [Rhodopseudomonas sp. BAL398]WOK20058.1 DUF3124 domain-containing protein [Rhodopseudomonas sp. BAL398]